jgi:hypothetical protein
MRRSSFLTLNTEEETRRKKKRENMRMTLITHTTKRKDYNMRKILNSILFA